MNEISWLRFPFICSVLFFFPIKVHSFLFLSADDSVANWHDIGECRLCFPLHHHHHLLLGLCVSWSQRWRMWESLFLYHHKTGGDGAVHTLICTPPYRTSQSSAPPPKDMCPPPPVWWRCRPFLFLLLWRLLPIVFTHFIHSLIRGDNNLSHVLPIRPTWQFTVTRISSQRRPRDERHGWRNVCLSLWEEECYDFYEPGLVRFYFWSLVSPWDGDKQPFSQINAGDDRDH